MATKALLAIGIMFLVSLGFVSGLIRPRSTSPPNAPPETAKAAPDATTLAKAMCGRLQGQRFTGIIEFDFEIDVLVGSGSTLDDYHRAQGITVEGDLPVGAIRKTTQHGKLYCLSASRVRLDTWEGDKPDPVVCCVRGNNAWMVWTVSPTVFLGPYPAHPKESGSWHNQLQPQAGQTLAWAETFLGAGVPAGAPMPVKSAEITDGKLTVQIDRDATDDKSLPVRIVAAPLTAGGPYFPTELTFGAGSVMSVRDPRATSGGATIPWRLDLDTTKKSVPHADWTIVSVEERDPTDADFLANFEPPTARSSAYPRLLGTCNLDEEGHESVTTWN